MNLYLLPVETVGIYRGPKYLRWRFNDQGISRPWSLKDFGNLSSIGLVYTPAVIERPDVLRMPIAWTQKDRDHVGGFLRSAGIEHRWVLQAGDWREAFQRVAGMALAMQSAVDDPALWMGREIHFGGVSLKPLDWQMYAREQESVRERVIAPLRVRWERERPRFDWQRVLKQMALMPLSILMGALPATDAFTTGSDQTLTVYSANWTNNSNAFSLVAATDDVYQSSGASNGGEGAAHWNADTFDNAQYGSIKQNALTGGNFRGPAVRCHASAATYYGLYADNSDHYMFKMVSGTWTQIGSTDTTNGAVNDILRLEVNGTTLTPKRNGSTMTLGAQTDSSIASGYAGICGYGTSTSARLDDWEGGNISSVTSKSGSDTTGVQASEGTTAIVASSTRTDTTDVSLTESVSIASSSTSTDTDSVSLGEAVAVQAGLSASETEDVSLSESAALVVSVSPADAMDVSVSEALSLDASSTRTDNADVTLSDATPAIAASSTRTDTNDVSLDDVSQVMVIVGVVDALDVQFDEASTISTNPGGTDSSDLSLDESVSIVVTFTAVDTLDVSLIESGQLGLTPVDVTDALDVQFSEGTSTIAVSLVRPDGVDVSFGEAASIFVTFAVNESVDIGMDDLAQVAVPVSVLDGLDVAVGESASTSAARNVFHLKYNEPYPFYPND